MPLDPDWIETLLPYEAQAALDALNAQKGPYTVNEAYELVKMKRALQAKVELCQTPDRPSSKYNLY